MQVTLDGDWVFSKIFMFLFYVRVHLCVCVCLFIPYVCSSNGDQKRASESRELGLQLIVSHPVKGAEGGRD